MESSNHNRTQAATATVLTSSITTSSPDVVEAVEQELSFPALNYPMQIAFTGLDYIINTFSKVFSFITGGSYTNIAMKTVLDDKDIVRLIFHQVPFKTVYAGCCVSKGWNHAISTDKAFAFLPSTPYDMGMDPSTFIKYLTTPSVTILESDEKTNSPYILDNDKHYISENGAVCCYGKKTHIKWDIKTKKPVVLYKGEGSINGITADGQILGNADVTIDGKPSKRAVLYNNDAKPIILPLESAYSISADGKVILGSSITTGHRVLYKDGNDEAIVCNTSDHFTPFMLLRDGKTLFGMKNEHCWELTLWRNGEMHLLPEGFSHLGGSLGQGIGEDIKGQSIIGTYQNGTVIYKNGELNKLPIDPYYTTVVTDDHIVCGIKSGKRSSSLWINDDCYSLEELFKESGIEFHKTDAATISDISRNNRIIVGWIRKNNEYAKPFRMVLPPRLFDKQ